MTGEIVKIEYRLSDKVSRQLKKIAITADIAENRIDALDRKINKLAASNGMSKFSNNTSSGMDKVQKSVGNTTKSYGSLDTQLGKTYKGADRFNKLTGDSTSNLRAISKETKGWGTSLDSNNTKLQQASRHGNSYSNTLERLHDNEKKLYTASENKTKSVGRQGTSFRGAQVHASNYHGILGKLGIAENAYSKALKEQHDYSFFEEGFTSGARLFQTLTKVAGVLPLVGVAAGGAAEGINALVVGAINAIGSLGRLGSVVAALPGAFAAVGVGVIGVKSILKSIIDPSIKNVPKLATAQAKVTSSQAKIKAAQIGLAAAQKGLNQSNANLMGRAAAWNMGGGTFKQYQALLAAESKQKTGVAKAQARLTAAQQGAGKAQKSFSNLQAQTPKGAKELADQVTKTKIAYMDMWQAAGTGEKPIQVAIDGLKLAQQLIKKFQGSANLLVNQLDRMANVLMGIARNPQFQAWVQQELATAIQNLGKMFDIAVKFIPMFTSLFNVSQKWFGTLLNLADGWADVLTQTSNVNKVTQDMIGWTNKGIKSIGNWTQIISNLGSVVKSIFSAASSTTDGFEKSLVGVTKNWKDWTDKGANVQKMQAFFGNTFQVLKGLGNLAMDVIKAFTIVSGIQNSKKGADSAAGVANSMVGFLNQVGQGLIHFAGFASKAVGVLGPKLEAHFAALGRLFGNGQTGNGLISAIGNLIDLSTKLVNSFANLEKNFPIMGKVLEWLLEARIYMFGLGVMTGHVGGGLARLTKGFEAFGFAIGGPLLKKISNIGKSIGSTFSGKYGGAANAIAPKEVIVINTAVDPVWVRVVGGLEKGLTPLWNRGPSPTSPTTSVATASAASSLGRFKSAKLGYQSERAYGSGRMSALKTAAMGFKSPATVGVGAAETTEATGFLAVLARFGPMLTKVAGSFTIIGTVIAAVISAGTVLVTNFAGIRTEMEKFFKDIAGRFTQDWNSFKTALGISNDTVKKLNKSLVNVSLFINALGVAIVKVLKGAVSFVVSNLLFVFDTIINSVKLVKAGVSGLIEIGQGIFDLFSDPKKGLGEISGGVKKIFGGVFNFLVSELESAWKRFGQFLSDTFGDFGVQVSNVFISVINDIIDKVKHIPGLGGLHDINKQLTSKEKAVQSSNAKATAGPHGVFTSLSSGGLAGAAFLTPEGPVRVNKKGKKALHKTAVAALPDLPSMGDFGSSAPTGFNVSPKAVNALVKNNAIVNKNNFMAPTSPFQKNIATGSSILATNMAAYQLTIKKEGNAIATSTDSIGAQITQKTQKWVTANAAAFSALKAGSAAAPSIGPATKGATPPLAAAAPLAFSKGGVVPGHGTKDTVHAVLTPGEVVLNKSQQANPFKAIEAMFGLKRTSGDNDAPGVHVRTSYHYRKAPWGGVEAYDYGNSVNSPAQLNAAAKYAQSNAGKFAEEFYNITGGSVKDGKFYANNLDGAENASNHLHLAISGGGAVMGPPTSAMGSTTPATPAGMAAKFGHPPKYGKSNLGTAVQSMANTAVHAANSQLAALNMGAAFGTSGGAATPYAGGGNMQSIISWAAQQYGANAAGLTRVAHAESGFNPNAINKTDINAQEGHPSQGLFQFIPTTFKSDMDGAIKANPQAWQGVSRAFLDPTAQSLAAAWAITNGRGGAWSTIAQYGKGGAFRTKKSQLIQVGERGPEDVTINPVRGRNGRMAGGGGSSGGYHNTSHFHIGTLVADDKGLEKLADKIGEIQVRDFRKARATKKREDI